MNSRGVAKIAMVIGIREDRGTQAASELSSIQRDLAPGLTGIYMSHMTRFVRTGGILMALCAAFAGCSSRTNVSATGATPTVFTHVFITTQAVWFNTAKGANPDDSGWAKFTLKMPITIDLVQQSNGTLGEIANDLRVAPGSYNSILLLPVDPASATLSDSGKALGALYPHEADYYDANGKLQQVQLTLPNWEKGIVASGTLKVPVGKPSKTGIGNTTNNGTSNSAFTLFGSPTTINPNTSNTNNTNTTNTTNNNSNTTTVSFGVNFEANRDLHMFTFPAGNPAGTPVSSSSTAQGVVLSASPVASDLSTTGGISGTLSLTTITNVTSNPSIANASSGRTAIQASAELVSADSSHHVIVASAPVQSDGTFNLYPLASNSRTPTAYDVVIHGPNIATIIIKSVSVTTTTPSRTAANSTSGSIATTTATGAVSLGTLIPRPAGNFPVVLTNGASLPAGAALTFYQTLPAANELPYAIDQVGLDPVNHGLVMTEALATNTIDSGTYSSNGGTITLTTSTPIEGPGTYLVGATAPLFTDSNPSGGPKVSGPAPATPPTNSGTVVQIPTMPTLSPENGVTGSISATIADTRGDSQGTLLVSHNGALIDAADLSQALKTGASVQVNVPGNDVYYLSVIVPNPNTQPASFSYQSLLSPVTVTSGGPTSVTVAIK
jgi:hypothetical protein